ncbi:chromate transporter [Caproicibacter sp.]|uniref:chromate transporter n=1 Tax=Caproicibacter sp. TaxID=2814884 RepID=UPI003989CB48
MIYLKLFWSFFQIGLFSIGGGYAAMPIIQAQVVDLNHWMSMKEFVDIITISQMTPGPIAINSSTFVGMRIAGVAGAVVATIGCVAPSCIIVLTIAYFYYKYQDLWVIKGALKGLRPSVVSLIASAGLSILLMALFNGKASSWLSANLSQFDVVAGILFLAAFIILRKFKANPITVMLGSGIVGLICYQFL